jgi:hypothetical protein
MQQSDSNDPFEFSEASGLMREYENKYKKNDEKPQVEN